MIRTKVHTITADGSGNVDDTFGMPSCRLLAVTIGNPRDGSDYAGTVTLVNAGRDVLNSVAFDATTATVELEPRENAVDSGGSAISGAYAYPVLHGSVELTMASLGAGAKLDVTLVYV